MTVDLYEVGGCVRDELLGIPTKDVDYTAVVTNPLPRTDPFEYLRMWLIEMDFQIFVSKPEYLTIRAHFPKGWNFAGRDCSKLTADFVLARKESDYTDGRRPDRVIPGTLADDLRRRDFTVNAMAKDKDGNLIDLFGGERDLRNGILRAVGFPSDRIREDALRAVRALRFVVTKQLTLDEDLEYTLDRDWLVPLLGNVSVDRRREELARMFKFSTLDSLAILAERSVLFREALFSGGLWLEPTLKG